MLRKMFAQMGDKKQFYWWIGSYTIIIILSILFNMIGYAVTINVLERELEKSSQSSVEHIRNIYDNYFREILNSSYNICQSQSMKQLSESLSLSRDRKSEYISNVMKDISNTLYNYRIIEKCMVILRNKDMFIDNAGMGSLSVIYNHAFAEYYETQEKWLDDIYSSQLFEFKLLTDMDGFKQIFITYSVPEIERNKVVVIKINPRTIGLVLKSTESENGERYFITDSSGAVLVPDQEEAGFRIDTSQDNHSITRNVNGEDSVISYAKSDLTDLIYMRIIPNSAYLRNIRTVRTAFIFSYLLSILIGVALSYWFTLINKRNKLKMEEKLALQSKYMQENVLRQILTGKVSLKKTDMSFLLEHNLMFTGKDFAVVVFDFTATGDGKEKSIYEKADDFEMLHNYILGQIATIDNTNNITAYFCEVRGMCTGVLNFIDGPPDAYKFKEMLNHICITLSEEMQISFVCTVSRFVEGFARLNYAYEQAMEIINCRFLGEDKLVFSYDDILGKNAEYEYGEETENKLINMLMLGKSEEAISLIDDLFNYNKNVKRINMSALRILISEIVSTLLKVSAQLEEDEIDYKDLYLLPTNTSNLSQMDETLKIIGVYIDKLCYTGKQITQSAGQQKYLKIIDYIKENYDNPVLNVNMISYVFHMNQSWLSKNFKETIGEGIADYIVKYRLKQAKELLKSDKTINKIASETGFSNADIFRRAFKKFEGVTPVEYRNLLNVSISE